MAGRRGQGWDFQRIVTLGDTVPRAVGGLLLAMLVSTVGVMVSQQLWDLLCLDGPRIFAGQAWRIVTWVFPQGGGQAGPINLLFAGFILHWLGRDLAHTWSEKRFLQVFFGYTAWAALWTAVLAWMWPAADRPYVGAWPVLDGLLVGWGLSRPGAQINLFGVVPMTGKVFAWLTTGATVLYAVSAPTGAGEYVPHLADVALAWLLAAGISPRRLWLKAKLRWTEARLKRGRSHLRPVPGDDRPRWMN
jgi:hypothetical protein